MSKEFKFIRLLFGGIGLLFSLLSGAFGFKTQQFIARSRPVAGEVIEMRQGRGSDSPSRSVAVVQFNWEGATQTLVTQVESSPPAYSLGQKVIVRVDPASPDDARVESWLENYFLVTVFGFIGGVFLLISFLMVRFGRRQESEPSP